MACVSCGPALRTWIQERAGEDYRRRHMLRFRRASRSLPRRMRPLSVRGKPVTKQADTLARSYGLQSQLNGRGEDHKTRPRLALDVAVGEATELVAGPVIVLKPCPVGQGVA
jgi:hypothetical protein